MSAIIITGSQHNRPSNWITPGTPPKTMEEWEALRDVPMQELCEAYSFGNWNLDGVPVALIPGEWHGALPEGLVLRCINGQDYTVGQDRIDNDIRFGCLAYGLVLREAK